ncbi:hypothetical protein EVAR_56863_1 [Eumeta japonica]|uniref:Uncharacterized protein n=1 Tax=Eumeta variegata TaxID=151549 RepID=A0A4C1YZH5_EUMVA|nr:hypothetical protein EVAR_56863_1 [Eumeta japonica]
MVRLCKFCDRTSHYFFLRSNAPLFRRKEHATDLFRQLTAPAHPTVGSAGNTRTRNYFPRSGVPGHTLDILSTFVSELGRIIESSSKICQNTLRQNTIDRCGGGWKMSERRQTDCLRADRLYFAHAQTSKNGKCGPGCQFNPASEPRQLMMFSRQFSFERNSNRKNPEASTGRSERSEPFLGLFVDSSL